MSQHKDKRKEVGWDELPAGTGASQPALRPTAQADGLLCGSQPALTVKEQKRGRRPTRTVFDRNKIESPTRWKNERPNHEQFRENPMPSLLKSVSLSLFASLGETSLGSLFCPFSIPTSLQRTRSGTLLIMNKMRQTKVRQKMF